ncbi:MAG: hypothetical protein MJE77_34945 [Proteobacteria bacterium]|nr:hypothetical protein [Pseudomonadota bacterium]
MTKPMRWGTFSIRGQYDMGFVDITDSESSALKNMSIALLIGYEYRRQHKEPDGDGIADDADGCPREAEDRNSIDDGDGCPDAKEDHDSDGVMDVEDCCRVEPEERNDVGDADGCPESCP